MGVLRPREGAGLPAWAGLAYGASVDRAGCVGPRTLTEWDRLWCLTVTATGRSRWSMLCEPGACSSAHQARPRSVQLLYKPGNQRRRSALVKDSSSLGTGGEHSLLAARAAFESPRKQGPLPKPLSTVLPGRGRRWARPGRCLSAPRQRLGVDGTAPALLPWRRLSARNPLLGGRGQLWVGCPCQSRGEGVHALRDGRFPAGRGWCRQSPRTPLPEWPLPALACGGSEHL